jgi:demethylmenaquinone methyltransferase/2-methoxy-6-polyprenyl-1,4-benzoquinol methylase
MQIETSRATAVESLLPYGGTVRKEVQVRQMFDAIASRYDLLNHIFSFGLDRLWRRAAIDFLRPYHPRTILDIASGTGDMALGMCRYLNPDRVIAADLSLEMMAIGARKAEKAGWSNRVSFEHQDCMALRYADCSFDAVTVAFGIRNFAHIEKGLAEMYRILNPDGHIVMLELSTPERFPVKQLYSLYSMTVIPFIGKYFGLEEAAYRYLPASIRRMPKGEQMLDLMAAQGFKNIRFKTFTFGVCSLYTGRVGSRK